MRLTSSSLPTTLERAFELARSGECRGIGDVKERLRKERHEDIEGQLYGRHVVSTLTRLCKEARGPGAEVTEAVSAGR